MRLFYILVSPSGLAVVASLVVLVVGLRLLRRGFRSRRIGDEPHCGSCDYLLIGIQRERCPECGNEISEETILRGQWQHRPGMVGTGLAIVLVAAGVGFHSGQRLNDQYDWYWARPTSLVMRDLTGSARSTRNVRAMNELMRRDSTWRMSHHQRTEMIEKAISSLATQSSMSVLYFEYLNRQILAGQVTAEQKRRLFTQLMNTSISTLGLYFGPGTAHFNLSSKHRGHEAWSVSINPIRGRVDHGEYIAFDADSKVTVGRAPSSSIQLSMPLPELGLHSFEASIRIEWFAAHNDRLQNQPMYVEQRTHRVTFDVFDNPAEGILNTGVAMPNGP